MAILANPGALTHRLLPLWLCLQARQPHPDIGCWWALYDYGLDRIKNWAIDYKHPYPGEARSLAKPPEKKASAIGVGYQGCRLGWVPCIA